MRDSGVKRRTWILGAVAAACCWLLLAPGTRAAIPPAPGGPILVVHGTDRFGGYLDEILRAEGLQEFATVDASGLDAAAVTGRQVVILGPTAVTDAQASMLAAWVQGGGDLIAMRPDPRLYGLLGLAAAGGTLADGDLQVDTSTAPGAGITGTPMQFHGTADRYNMAAGTRAVAGLTAGGPAVTLRAVGGAGGQAAAFAYDLGRSVVYTHQGNPAWAGQERDEAVDNGGTTIRSDDLFFGGALPDYVDLDRVQIPQADEQQRLLANLVTTMASDRLPVPRLWYLPHGAKAAIVMTGDEHQSGNGGTEFAFDRFKAQSPPGCSVADWECVRATSYVFPRVSVAPDAAKVYQDEGFEVALHLSIPGPSDCNNYTSPGQVVQALDDQLDGTDTITGFLVKYPNLNAPATIRTHCIVWSDWDSEVRADLSRGIRLNTDYYYWPASWVDGRSGMFTGAGFPMRFAALDGSLHDVFQAPTELPDETYTTGDQMADAVQTLLDNAVGPKGYYGAFTANVHNDSAEAAAHATADAIVAAARARGVPVVSARQMLTWLDGRDASSFGGLQFADGVLTFTMDADPQARGLQAMLPVHGPAGDLTGLTRDGQAVTLTARAVKGVDYAVFDAAPGAYSARYAGGGGGAPPPPPGDDGSGTPGGGGGTSAGGGGKGAGPGVTGSGTTPAKPKVYDHTPPRLVLGGATRQRFAGAVAVSLRAASENLWARVRTTIRVPGHRGALHLTTQSGRFVAKGRTRALRLTARRATVRSLRRALAAGTTLTATITVRARDAAGNVTTRTRTVRVTA
jgi:hypothetical protein